jgi:hypothetical protein
VEVDLDVSLNVLSHEPDIPDVPSRVVSSCYGSLQDPSFYTPGSFDLQSHGTSNHSTRPEDPVLGVSFNTQSQSSDIPDVSLHNDSSRYATSFQDQSLVSDIQVVSLRVYMEEISASFNTQDQVPDDSYTQDHRGDPCIFFDIPHKGTQVFVDNSRKVIQVFEGYTRSKSSHTFSFN